MKNQNGIALGARVIFQFKGRSLIPIFLCVVLIIIGYVGVAWVRRSAFGGVMFFFISLSFIFLVSGLLLTGLSDVVVDDHGISRCLLGKTWQTIGWGNLRLVTAFPVSGGYGYSARGFNFYPVVKPRISLMPSGKMSFTDKMKNAPELIEILNHYALKHGIKIEIRDTLLGKLTSAARL